jgi:hypothetical protein
LSLSEIEAIALKAARGAGMAWGLAEEAAFATRWMAEQGVDGLTLLALHLDRAASTGFGQPQIHADRSWTSGTLPPLCPIAAGAALSDHFLLACGPLAGAVRLCAIACPALILPFLAAAAALHTSAVIVHWPGGTVVLAHGNMLASPDNPALMLERADEVVLTAVPLTHRTAAFLTVSGKTRQVLEAQVQRTYVPASEQSRRGAGAAGNDDI